MCGTFIKALGYEVGNSEIEYEYLEFASRLLDKSNGVKSRVWLPSPTTVNGFPASFWARNTPKTAP